MIKRVNVDRVWKKKPLEVKEEAWNFFKHRFSGEQWLLMAAGIAVKCPTSR